MGMGVVVLNGVGFEVYEVVLCVGCSGIWVIEKFEELGFVCWVVGVF